MQIGLYSAAAGMAAQQDRMDALANDIANVNTDGYKAVRLGFRDLVYGLERGVSVGAGAALVQAGRDQTEGALQQSSNPLAVALSGPGFFQVRRPDGTIALTRDGDFSVDARGALVTGTGDRVVPPIAVPRNVDPATISIAPNGTLRAGKQTLGRLVVVDVPAPAGLIAAGDDVFLPSAASGAPRAVRTGMQQGYVEGSNVDLANSMTSILDAQRSFEMDSRVIQTQDQMMQIANGIRQ